MSTRAKAVQLLLALVLLAVLAWVVAGGGASLIGDVVGPMFAPR